MSLFTDDDRGAELSDDGVYRYRLWRAWGPGPRVLFVMLNPSTADADTDDPTIKRCIGYAMDWGFDGIEVCNLFAYRATDPNELQRAEVPLADPYDYVQVRAVTHALRRAGRIIVAWGAHPLADQYERKMLELLAWARLPIETLKLTKAGAPSHPLRLRGDAQPLVYEGRS